MCRATLITALLAHSVFSDGIGGVVGVGAWGGGAACPSVDARPWCDPGKPLAERVALLVAAVPTEDLAPQLTNDLFGGVPAIESLGLMSYNYIRENDHGLLLTQADPAPTSFPQVITTASSFNASLYRAIGEASATQARFFWEVGFTQGWDGQKGYLNGLLLQNNINIFRDPRWGRGQETPGEDPHLTSVYVATWAQGVQAPKGPRGIPLAGLSCKHFGGYSFEGGPTLINRTTGIRSLVPGFSNISRHSFNAVVDERDLADTYLPVFQSCIEAGAKGTMCSYNQVNGVPMCGNKDHETGFLRDSWGFEGMVVTDCDSIADMYYPQKWRPTPNETVQSALESGTDVSCGPHFFKDHATPAMEPLLRRSLARALRVRFELGEFDPPAGPRPETKPTWIEAARQLALEAAQQSGVLLKNEGGVLPLAKSARVALLGPLRGATRSLLGSYSPDPVSGPIISPEAALRDASGGRVFSPVGGPEVCSTSYTPVGRPDADVAIIVGGIFGDDHQVTDPDMRPVESAICRGNCLEVEGCDRRNVSWPLAQERLLHEATTWGMPVVLVIFSGGPLDLSKYKAPESGISAILWMGYPGEMGGVALADLVYGAVSPSGRLPQTFYSSKFTAAVDIKDMRMRPHMTRFRGSSYPGRTYRFVDEQYVVYPFGHGLSYASWSYSKASCECRGFDCKLSFTVSSSSELYQNVATSVLLFARPPPRSQAPKRELKRFTRVQGASMEHRVSFALRKRDFELANTHGIFQLLPGDWTFTIGEPVEEGTALVIRVGQAFSCHS